MFNFSIKKSEMVDSSSHGQLKVLYKANKKTV